MTMQVDKARLDALIADTEFTLGASVMSGGEPMEEYSAEILSALVELRSLRSTEGKEGEIEQLKRERDEALKSASILLSAGKEDLVLMEQAAATIRTGTSRAEAAEAHVAKLREALEPFAALYVESMRDFPDGSSKTERPDDKQAWGFNNVDLTWGDFRRAAALTRSPE